MPRERLGKERIRALYQRYLEVDPWPQWHADFLPDLQWARGLTPEQMKAPDAQRRLWSLKGLGTAGPSESLDVTAATVDGELVELLDTLARRAFHTAPSPRAQELQTAYDRIVARLEIALNGGAMPRARLQRLLHALRPGDLVCAYNQRSLYTIRDFLVGRRGLSVMENHVHIRARLREVLGREEESDLAEHMRRSTFCWWLYENAEVVDEGGLPGQTAPDTPPSGDPTGDDSIVGAEEVKLWPLSRQYRWLDMYRGGLDTVRLVLRECLEPQPVDLLASALQDDLELEGLRPRYLMALLRDLRRLGLVEKQGDDYRTTDLGEAVLDGGGEEPLAVALTQRLRGFAWSLRSLSSGVASRKALAERLTGFVPDASLRHLAHRHLWWATLTGLVQRQSGSYTLTPKGRALHARLPADLERPAPAAPDDGLLDDDTGDDDDDAVPRTDRPEPTYPELQAAFDALAAEQGLVFSPTQVLALHTAWRFGARGAGPAKRFAILSGLSGTGKTQLLRQYARATCAHMGLDPERHIQLVPVRPDWRDPTGLLGYLNALHAEPSFQAEPALTLVLSAARNPGLPYFLLLDEMNLARVERYFAPFLSAMETGDPLDLHAHDGPVSGVPPRIRWPGNLRIGGTVNMDETTHPFSDKVLDRAFTLEFWEVDLERFFTHRPGRTADDAPVEEALRAFQGHLRPIRRHVGYRTAGEVLGWVAEAREASGGSQPIAALLDQALFSKVLPRLRGAETRPLHDALDALLTEARQRSLPLCAAKLSAMKQRLTDTGVTGFWA